MRVFLVALAMLGVSLAGCLTDGITGGPDIEQGELLSSADIEALGAIMNDQPLASEQEPWPNHQIKWIDEETFIFIHYAADDDGTQRARWIGLGVRGHFCPEDQPSPAFTHFHRANAPSYAEGHGGDPGTPGFWLLHANVAEFDSPFGPTGRPGHHEQFSPTPPTRCGEDDGGTLPDLPPPVGQEQEAVAAAESGTPLSSDDINALADIMTDQPLSDGQEPWPSHLLKWVNEDVFIFLHFDAEDPREGTRVLWYGMGVAGEFCEADQPGPEFTHFHRANADAYPQGHGGDPGMKGFGLMHLATHDFESPFGQTGGPGIHHEFGVTPPPTCS